MKFKFLIEKPSSEDKFKGESHDLVAKSIVNIFEEKPDIHMIGLEGTLGSGKSTVIELVKEKLKDKPYEFIIFDVEQHHYSSTKRAFIEIFSDRILTIASNNSREAINDAKDRALGNLLEYDKYNKSRMSWWVAGFIISIVFSATSVKPLFNHIDLYFTGNNFQFFCKEFFAWISLFLSPVIVLSVMKFFSLFNTKIPTVGDLFKRNSKDTITERLSVTREVGSIDLRNAMQVFIDAIPNEKIAVLIIDNLDRVSTDKVREIWSDIEIFTSLAKQTLRIILPFSNHHIAAAISDDESEQDGYEFIAKRIPVSFRVPPIVSAGWQETFENFWCEASPEAEIQTIKTCAYLLDLLLPDTFNGHVTPRLMKRFINDIHSIILTTPGDIHPIAAAFYIVTVQYGNKAIGYTIESLIEQPSKSDLIRTAQKKLNLRMRKESVEWPIQLMCIHYQTESEIAQSELLMQPLMRGLNKHDGKAFIDRAHIYGFDNAVQEILNEGVISDSIKLTNVLFNEDSEFSKKWVENYLGIINYELDFQLSNESDYQHDGDFVDSLINLINHEVELDLKPIEHLYYSNLNEVKKVNDGEIEKEDCNYNGIESLYKYSQLIKKKPSFITAPTEKYYVDVLWPSRNEWVYWDIENIQLSSKKISSVLIELYQSKTESPPVDISLNIINRLKLGMLDLSKGLNEEAALTVTGYDNFIRNTDIKNVHDIIFDHRWYITDSVAQYTAYINRVDDVQVKEELIAQLLVQLIQRGAYANLPQWNVLAAANPGYKSYVLQYLPLITNFSLILSALEQKGFLDILKDDVESLIISRKIQKLNISFILTDAYSLLKNVIETPKSLLGWLEVWATNVNQDEMLLETFDEEFVKDVTLNSDGSAEYLKILYGKIDNTILDEKEWVEIITDKPTNALTILQYMKTVNYNLKFSDELIHAIEKLFTDDKYEEKINTLNSPGLFDILLFVIDKTKREALLNALSNSLLLQSLSSVNKERIIMNIENNIKLPPTKLKVDQEIIVSMLNSITIDETTAEWLDKQSYYFENWKKDQLEDIANCIYKHGKWFKTLHEEKLLSPYINKLVKIEDDANSE